ncbi:MAG: metallophosphoesterase family protein [Verrucomicrobia bacterium]|nr:metallophosphoesterase family protein [Verrucomicrobiota bacterium]
MKSPAVSVLSACLLLPLVCLAHEPAPPAAFPDKAIHAPRPMPDRIVLTWDGDPATTQAVTWRTDTSVGRAEAELAVANENGRDLKGTKVPATTTALISSLGPAHYHSAGFRDLRPDTLYAYRVGDGVNWSEWSHFRTASRTTRAFSFLYFGDAQNDIRTHWSRVFREAFRQAPRAAFTLHAGDLINNAHNDAQWGEWFGAPAWVNATLPVVPIAGNHEYARLDEKDEKAPRVLSRNWRPQFTLPENGPADLAEVRETAYWFDYQGARIVSLDSNVKQEEQVPWLRATLQANPQRWTILAFHHPIFSPARNRDNAKLRELWKPVLDEFKVDLVLTGHDHTYARSGDVSSRVPVGDVNQPKGYNQVYDPAIGTVYVVSVSGPKMYDITSSDWAVRSAEDTQLFQVITVDGDELRFEARTATNRLYDAFTLRKRPGEPNLLIETLPPQRRRPAAPRTPKEKPE